MKHLQLDHDDHQASPKKYPLCFLAHNIDVPMNVGSVFRIADAFGIEKVYLTGSSAVPPNSKIKKTSRSTEKYVPHVYCESALEVVQQLKSKGYTIVSLEITSSSTDIRDFVASGSDKICLILGSENHGVASELLVLSDYTVHIPMLGHNSSMNIATACAIAAFEVIKAYLPSSTPPQD